MEKIYISNKNNIIRLYSKERRNKNKETLLEVQTRKIYHEMSITFNVNLV